MHEVRGLGALSQVRFRIRGVYLSALGATLLATAPERARRREMAELAKASLQKCKPPWIPWGLGFRSSGPPFWKRRGVVLSWCRGVLASRCWVPWCRGVVASGGRGVVSSWCRGVLVP